MHGQYTYLGIASYLFLPTPGRIALTLEGENIRHGSQSLPFATVGKDICTGYSGTPATLIPHAPEYSECSGVFRTVFFRITR